MERLPRLHVSYAYRILETLAEPLPLGCKSREVWRTIGEATGTLPQVVLPNRPEKDGPPL